MPGQPVGGAIQFGERKMAALEIDGDRVGASRDLGLDQLVQAGGVRIVLGRIVPLHEDLPLLPVGEDRQPANRLVHVGGDCLQQRFEMPQHPLDRSGIEQIDVVLDVGLQTGALVTLGRGLAHRQPEIELGRLVVQGNVADREVLKAHSWPGGVLQREEDLKQRVAAGVALGVQGLDQALERHLLVLECLQRGLADPLQDFAKGRIAGQVRADHQRVGQKSDEALGLLACPSGDGRADGKIVLAAVAMQQHLESRQQGHVKRGALRRPASFTRWASAAGKRPLSVAPAWPTCGGRGRSVGNSRVASPSSLRRQ